MADPHPLRRAVFLDRDGTINEEVDYLHQVEDFVFIPGAPEAIKRLKDAGFLLVVVTNQSGVARGYFPLSAVERLHRHLQSELATRGTSIDAFYICPHHPTEGTGEYRMDCDCRKGNPGMLLRAAREYGIDLSRSFMIGDKVADLEAGRRARCRSLLVLTGYGTEERKRVKSKDLVFRDLGAAAEFIIAQEEPVF